jgi:hypothetical protein
LKKRIFAGFIGLVMLILMNSASVASSADENYLNIYWDYFERHPDYSEAVWNGRTAMRDNTVYYVDRVITVTARRNVPATSMLVVRDGGYITISGSGSIQVRGYLGVEEGGIIDMSKDSQLILAAGSKSGINGGLYVAEGAEVRIFSELYLYTNGITMISGTMRTANNGIVYFTNTIRTFNNGIFRGNRERMSGMNGSPVSLSADMSRVDYMRFFDRDNRTTYTIRDQNVINRITDGLFKIRLIPLRESTPIRSDFENRYAISLYDSRGREIFHFERPEHENGNLVYMNGVTYTYNDAGMTYDEFYFYAMGVRAFMRR